MKRLTIEQKIILCFTAMFLLIIAAAVPINYFMMSENLYNNAKAQLQYEVDEILKSISEIYNKNYKTFLEKLVGKQVEAQQTEDPLIIAEFTRLRKITSQFEEEVNKIEKERAAFQEVNKKIHSYIRLGGIQRNKEFFDDEKYSFLK